MATSNKVISTLNAPKAVGPYSQGIHCENFVFISGQMPIDPKNNKMVNPSFTEQTNQSMKNIVAILKECNMTVDNIVKTTIYLTDMEKFEQVNEVYTHFFKDHYPARSCIEVNKLPKGALVEIEAIAAKNKTVD